MDTRKSQLLTGSAINQLKEALDHHTDTSLKKSCLWRDRLRQVIPIPGCSSVSELVKKAEQSIRWDGRVTDKERASLFFNIERLALQGSGVSKINAMQSLAKITHGLSVKDFPRLKEAGYTQDTLMEMLSIKTQALGDLKTLSNRARLQPMQGAVNTDENPGKAVAKSLASTVYTTYLLWWLGMGECKYSPLLWSFKLGKLVLKGLFLKGLVESILEVINCRDKKGFRMFYGDFEIWSNDLTPDCFNEFVRQFRFISTNEAFEPFLEQFSNFDLRAVESIDLSDKNLNYNEARQILDILYQRAPVIKRLSLRGNDIHTTWGLPFPNSLLSLNLQYNDIGPVGAKWLQLPLTLQSLDLSRNNISDKGVNALLKKIPKTKLTRITCYGNPYNVDAIKSDRAVQQQSLLRNCRDKLCHVNTPLSQQDEYQTSGATSTQPPLFFSWFTKPLAKLIDYAGHCMGTTLDSLGARLTKVVLESPLIGNLLDSWCCINLRQVPLRRLHCCYQQRKYRTLRL